MNCSNYRFSPLPVASEEPTLLYLNAADDIQPQDNQPQGFRFYAPVIFLLHY